MCEPGGARTTAGAASASPLGADAVGTDAVDAAAGEGGRSGRRRRAVAGVIERGVAHSVAIFSPSEGCAALREDEGLKEPREDVGRVG